MCGYGVQQQSVAAASKRIWTNGEQGNHLMSRRILIVFDLILGCIEIVRVWAERNLYTIAGIALGAALSQLLVIYLAKTLEGQIDLQKSRWSS